MSPRDGQGHPMDLAPPPFSCPGLGQAPHVFDNPGGADHIPAAAGFISASPGLPGLEK